MKTKEARSLVRGLIVDLDGAICNTPRDPDDRHSAAASAAILATRLLGGVAINVARIAFALERIADNTEPEDQPDD